MKKPPSINAVAELAGVSIATVSRVLNNSKPVNEATRKRVEMAVAQVNYRPNAFGRGLAMAEGRIMLVLVPDLANPFYAQIVKGIESVTRANGWRILFSDSPESSAESSTSLDVLHNGLASGVISLAHFDEHNALIDRVKHLPWVACSEFLPGSGIPYVSIDHRVAAMDAMQYLLNRGHRRIAFINTDEPYIWARQRREGYEAALKRAGLKVDPQLMRSASGTDYQQGAEAAGGLMALVELPTAVFAVSDTLAIGAIKAIQRAGRRVPDDIAVIGFDNVPIADVFEPGLTTIAQPMEELGIAATELLLSRLADEVPASRTLAHTLVIRASA